MTISEIFTKKNLEILEVLARQSLHIRDIASRLECSPAKVHDTIQLLKKHSLVKEENVKNKKIITLNKSSQLWKKIEILLDEGREVDEKEESIRLFSCVSPLDYRYYGRKKEVLDRLSKYMSEEAFVKYQCKVELALVKALAKLKLCPKEVPAEVSKAISKVTAQEVYREEDRIKHNIRGLVNQIRKNVSDKSKPYVHFTTTSFDIFDTANALRFKEVAEDILLPDLLLLEKTLIDLAKREKETIQIGRTHGQHAEPITFGFTISSYVSRLGCRILALKRSVRNLRGKISGAVGAYNASSLFFSDPEKVERAILSELGLKPSAQSSQIVEPEFISDYMHTVVSIFGILAQIADDMRALQRSEINEIAEQFGKDQVGSSTMPHKRNPINFENIKSMWKEFMPRMMTVYMDQISEHQRDLTNSASQRFLPELVVALDLCMNRLTHAMRRLVVDKKSLLKNFDQNKWMIAAEPAYILLAAHNHPDAHEVVRRLTVEAQKSGTPFVDLFFKDNSLAPYVRKFSKKQIEILKDPKKYVGIAPLKVDRVCNFWTKELGLK